MRDALSLLDQIIAYVGDAPITHDKVVEVLGVADRRLLQGLHAGGAGARRRPRRCACWPRPSTGASIWCSCSRSFLGFIHDAEMVALVDQPADLVDATAEEIAELRALAARTPRGLGSTLFDRWARAVDEAGKSQTPRLLLEMALVDLCFAEPLLPLGDLLDRLEELEARLQGGAPAARPPGGRPPGDGGGPPARQPGRQGRRSGARPQAGGQRRTTRWPAPVPPAPPRRPGPPPRPSRLRRPRLRPAARMRRSRLLRLRLQDRPALAAALDHARGGVLGRRGGWSCCCRTSCCWTRRRRTASCIEAGAGGA